MYLEFMKTLTIYIEALNKAWQKCEDEGLDSPHLCPYLGEISVMYEGALVGHLTDEIGGAFSWREIVK